MCRVPYRGERFDPQPADLVPWRRSLRGQHGAVLRLAGAEEGGWGAPCSDGPAEAVSQSDDRACATDSDPVRQIPHHAARWNSCFQSPYGLLPTRLPAPLLRLWDFTTAFNILAMIECLPLASKCWKVGVARHIGTQGAGKVVPLKPHDRRGPSADAEN